MPACVYLSEYDILRYRETVKDDADIQEWLGLANKLDGDDWTVHKKTVEVSSWWNLIFKPKTVDIYSLLVNVHQGAEYQIINFPPGNSEESTITHYVGRQAILSFLLGFVIGKESNPGV